MQRDRKDKENNNECMTDEGWNEERRQKKTATKKEDKIEGGVKNKRGENGSEDKA